MKCKRSVMAAGPKSAFTLFPPFLPFLGLTFRQRGRKAAGNAILIDVV